MASLEERLDNVQRLIKEDSFRQNKGLGNEVGYYVFDYPPEKELIIRKWVDYMKQKNLKGADAFELIVFDLYDIVIDILESEGFIDQCIQFEKRRGFVKIVKSVGRTLKINDDDSLIVKHIQENTPEHAVVFLTGIGKSYPILRSHKILNNFHQAFDRVPVVLFYPGKYDGKELILFSTIKDGNWYRAFKLFD